MKQDFFLISGC